jgi:hypothetical protein
MIRQEVVQIAESLGWKQWGKFRRYKGGNSSRYQCFRKKNDYIWIGNYYIEHSSQTFAHDYVNGNKVELLEFLQIN